MYTTLIFDLDGTLVDCKELHQFAFREAVTTYCPECLYTNEEVEGRPTYEKIKILQSKGYDLNEDKIQFLKQTLTQKHIKEYVDFNLLLYTELKRLSKTYNIGLASNATELFVTRVLEITNLKEFFTVINTATEFPPKPDPYTYNNCMEKLNAVPHETIIFEDSPIGILGAKTTGAKVEEVIDSKDLITKLQVLD